MNNQNKQGNLHWNTIIDDSNSESTLSAEKIKEQERRKGIKAPFYIGPKIFEQNTSKEETSPGDEIVRINVVREETTAESYKEPNSGIQNHSNGFEITTSQTPNTFYQQCPQQNVLNTNTYYQQIQPTNNYCPPQIPNHYQQYPQPITPIYDNDTPSNRDHSYLTIKNMRSLEKFREKEFIKAEARIYEKRKSAEIEVTKKRMLNDENFLDKVRTDNYKDQRKNSTMSNTLSNNLNADNKTNSAINVKDAVMEFITEKALVKIKNFSKYKIMILSEDENRHVAISSQNLEVEYTIFLEEKFPDYDILPQNIVNRSMNLLDHSIPKLKKSNLIKLKPHQIMFMNGYLDITQWKFFTLSETERKKYYTPFSFDIDYSENHNKPVAFDALLDDSLNNDVKAKELFYEQMGAILTSYPTIKKFFVFQGVSNSGKTRISNIIAKCMLYEDTIELSNLAEISNDRLISEPIRLLYVKELGKNKIPAKQIVKLKAFADGSSVPDTFSFKILLNTNYAIITDENDTIEPALKNRLSILPFPKPMSNSDPRVACFEDVYFEDEKLGIITKALQAFSNVLKNKKFSHEFEPNVYVHNEESQKQTSLDEEFSNDNTLSNEITKTKQTQLEQIMNELFEFTDKVNPNMTTKNIFKIINHQIPNEFKDEASAGKRIHKIFGDKIKSDRKNGETCYNLQLKANPIDN